MGDRTGLAGKRIMLVEADPFLAAYVGQGLSAAGAQIVGPFSSVEAAALRVEEADAVICTLDRAAETDFALPTVWTSARALTGRPEPRCFYRPFGAFQIVEAAERLLLSA
jgi:hypothetical protein